MQLKSIKLIGNFRVLQNIELQFHPITLIHGLPGTGKSTLLQFIFALSQSRKSKFVKAITKQSGEWQCRLEFINFALIYSKLGSLLDIAVEGNIERDRALQEFAQSVRFIRGRDEWAFYDRDRCKSSFDTRFFHYYVNPEKSAGELQYNAILKWVQESEHCILLGDNIECSLHPDAIIFLGEKLREIQSSQYIFATHCYDLFPDISPDWVLEMLG